jgi:elongation factor Ts
MPAITAQMVSQLREQTQAGMMECKKALTEADGDLEKARDILRAKGQASADKRRGRAAADGAVAIAETADAVAMIELNSETDFVARNEAFRSLADQVAQAAAATPHDNPDALREAQTDGGTVGEKIDAALATLRENLVLRRTARYEKTPNSIFGTYIHRVDHKTGVLVELTGDANNADLQELARGIAMHVAANKPAYLTREDVPAAEVEREREVMAEKTRNEGKPEAAIPKIVEGRIGKFFEQICLVEQPYVRDPSKKIGQLAQESGAQVRRFALFLVGQD